jgi:hypothetical protein
MKQMLCICTFINFQTHLYIYILTYTFIYFCQKGFCKLSFLLVYEAKEGFFEGLIRAAKGYFHYDGTIAIMQVKH